MSLYNHLQPADVPELPLLWVVRVGGDDEELPPWHYIYVFSIESRLIWVFTTQKSLEQIFKIIFTLIFLRILFTHSLNPPSPQTQRAAPGRTQEEDRGSAEPGAPRGR